MREFLRLTINLVRHEPEGLLWYAEPIADFGEQGGVGSITQQSDIRFNMFSYS